MPHLQMVQVMPGTAAVRAALPAPPEVDSLFLSGRGRSSKSTTPLRAGVPSGTSLCAFREEGRGATSGLPASWGWLVC